MHGRWCTTASGTRPRRPGGLVGPLLARGSAQTLRLAVVYALLDGSDRIGVEHVEAAHALWRHSARSVWKLFGGSTGNPIAEQLSEAADRAGPEGISRTEMFNILGRNRTKAELDVALDEVVATGRYWLEQRGQNGPGRPTTVLVRHELNEFHEGIGR
jgi:hypothetical protein